VSCEACREALSAQLDGEEPPDRLAGADEHLAGCAGCRRWYDRAAAVTRLARTGTVADPVDVTGVVLPAAPGPGRARLAAALRVALGLVGVAQLTFAVRHLVAAGSADGHVHGGAVLAGTSAGHLWHESAAWAMAVGAGLLWISLRPGRLAGALPILSVFVGVLVLLNLLDAVSGRLALAHLASHALVLVGYAIVLAMSRPSLTRSPPPVPAVVRRAAGDHEWAGPDPPWAGRAGATDH